MERRKSMIRRRFFPENVNEWNEKNAIATTSINHTSVGSDRINHIIFIIITSCLAKNEFRRLTRATDVSKSSCESFRGWLIKFISSQKLFWLFLWCWCRHTEIAISLDKNRFYDFYFVWHFHFSTDLFSTVSHIRFSNRFYANKRKMIENSKFHRQVNKWVARNIEVSTDKRMKEEKKYFLQN